MHSQPSGTSVKHVPFMSSCMCKVMNDFSYLIALSFAEFCSTISNLICIGLTFQSRHMRSYMMFLCTSEVELIKYVLD